MNVLPPDTVARIVAYPPGTGLLRIAAETGAAKDTVARYRNGAAYACHDGAKAADANEDVAVVGVLLAEYRRLCDRSHEIVDLIAETKRIIASLENEWSALDDKRAKLMDVLKTYGADTTTEEPTKALPAPTVVPEPREKPKPHATGPAFRNIVDPEFRTLPVRWPPERTAIVERDYPTYRLTADILADLNALPGEAITGIMLNNFAHGGLRLWRPADYITHTRRERGERSAGWCTPVRKAILARDYPAGVDWGDLRAALEATEGPPLPRNTIMGSYCLGVMKLLRPAKVATTHELFVEGAIRAVMRGEHTAMLREATHGTTAPFAETVTVTVAATPEPKPSAVLPKPMPPKVDDAAAVRRKALDAVRKGPPLLARAMELPPRTVHDTIPIEADLDTIRAVASRWGVAFRGEVDLWAVNQAARHNGERPFRLVAAPEPKPRTRPCMRCRKPFEPKHDGNRLCNRCNDAVAHVVNDA